MPGFVGFTPDLFEFLQELSENNHKAFWDAQKDRYERSVREPALAFIAAMIEPLAAIAPAFEAVPRKVGGSLMRPHRDTRFSADKTPYKTNVGIQFRHRRGKDVHAPGFYVHLSPDELFFGVGVWHPDPPALAAIRAAIVDRPGDWATARAPGTDGGWTQGGASLTRPPKGYPADHPWAADLRRKDHVVSRPVEVDEVLDPGFVEAATEAFTRTAPYAHFLCGAMGLPWAAADADR